MAEAAAPVQGGQGTSSAILNTAASTQTVQATSTSEVATPPAQPQPPSTIEWLKDADELTTGYVQNKGWDNPTKVVQSYQNLEKLLGADKAGNAIIVPKPDADPKEWAGIYDRLGRPTAPDGYKVPLPEGGSKESHEAVLAKIHELGLSKSQGESLVNWYNEQVSNGMKAANEAKSAQFQKDDQSIKQEWGAAYTQNLAQAQAAARFLGLDAQTIDKISESLGHKGTMQLLQKIGSRAVESDFVDGGSDRPGFGSVMSPAQAKAEIQQLANDKGFRAKMMAKDAASMQRWDQLHQWAYPE